MSNEITLISAFGSISDIMPAAMRFAPKKIILITAFNSEENIIEKRGLIGNTLGTVSDIEDIEVDDQDVYQISKKIVSIIDRESASSRDIIANISGSSIYVAIGLLFACYARTGAVKKIVVPQQKGRELSEFPKLEHDLNDTRQELLGFLIENGSRTAKNISIPSTSKKRKSNKPATLAYVYQQLGYMEQRGYVTSSEKGQWNITLGGKLAVLNAANPDELMAKYKTPQVQQPGISLPPIELTESGNSNFTEIRKEYEQLSSAIKKSPRSADLYKSRGLVLLKLKKYDDALKDYAKSISLNPDDNWIAYKDRGIILSQLLNRDSEAITEYNKGLSLKSLPINYKNALLLGRSLANIKLGYYSDAVNDCKSMISIDPNQWEAYNNIGFVYVQQQKYTDAITNYDRAILINPNLNWEAFYSRGFAKFKLNLYKDAVEDISIAIRRNPNSIDSYRVRGISYNHLMKYDLAIKDLTQVLEANNTDPEALYERSLAYASSHRMNRALADLEIFKSIHPSRAASLEQIIKKTR